MRNLGQPFGSTWALVDDIRNGWQFLNFSFGAARNPGARSLKRFGFRGDPRAEATIVEGRFKVWGRLLGGSWDLVTTYNWAYDPTYNPLNGLVGVTPILSKVISPVMSIY